MEGKLQRRQMRTTQRWDRHYFRNQTIKIFIQFLKIDIAISKTGTRNKQFVVVDKIAYNNDAKTEKLLY